MPTTVGNLGPMLAQTVMDACGTEAGIFCRLIYDVTGSDSAASISETLGRPIKVILILAVTWIIVRFLHRGIDRGVESWIESRKEDVASGETVGRVAALRDSALLRSRKAAEQRARGVQRAATLGAVLRSLTSIVVYSIGAMISLGEFDINLGPLIASAGIVGVAVGFGAQTLVKDFLSGIFMLLEEQYAVGDIVDVGETTGVVEEVKLRTTQIRDVNGTLWHVPNGSITRVANMSQEWARAVLDIEVSYDTDLGVAMGVIKDVADSVWRDELPHATIIEEPEIWGVQSFGADAVAIRLVVKVEPGEQWATGREIRRRIKTAFDDAGIDIPFPQRTVWLHSAQDNAAVSLTSTQSDSSHFTPKTSPEGEVGV